MKTTEHMSGGWSARMLVAAAGMLACGATALADEVGQTPSGKTTTIFGDGLEDLRGGDAATTISIQNSQDLTASVESVSITAGTINTGTINIGEQAFDNFSGIGAFNVISGNNNAVNNAVEVTFTLE